MRVAIRADAAVHMGSGHVVRCATLASELRRRSVDVVFFCRDLPGNYIGWLRDAGHAVHVLPAPEGPPPAVPSGGPAHLSWLGLTLAGEIRDMELALASHARFDWVVVDHYALDSRWEKAIRRHGARIFAIDDLADRGHDADLLLDQGLPATPDRYRGLIPSACLALVGPIYAPLRPEFALLRTAAPTRSGELRRLLVFMGGSDARNLTCKVIEALAEAGLGEREVDVVLGGGSPHAAAVGQACVALPNCRIHVQTPRMAELMASADLMIGASGGATWERLCLGLPGILIPVAANQLPVATQVARRRASIVLSHGFDVDVPGLAALLCRLDKHPDLLRRISARASGLVDGLGADRVVTSLLASKL